MRESSCRHLGGGGTFTCCVSWGKRKPRCELCGWNYIIKRKIRVAYIHNAGKNSYLVQCLIIVDDLSGLMKFNLC